LKRFTVYLLFFLSGSAGLIYQVVWMRKLTLILGVTSEAVTTVLAVFMGGLALGSWLLGRAGDETRSPLRFYGWLELGIAVFGFQSAILLDGLLDTYVTLKKSGAFSPEIFPLIRFALACAALIGPTTLMGATLPILIKGICRTKNRIARASGLLYAINTLGAVAGTLVAAFFLIRTVGIQNTIFVAAGINLLVGLWALLLARREQPASLSPEEDEEKAEPGLDYGPVVGPAETARSVDSGTVRAVVVAFGISGFLALAYEVLWTRYLIYIVGENSVYAFSMMLAAFLLGIVLGSFIASLIGDRVKNIVALFGGVQVLIGAAAFGTVAIMGLFYHGRHWGDGEFWADSMTRFGKCLAVLIVPTTLSGSTFAIVARIYAQDIKNLGRSAGRAYAVNTVGAIFGAAAGGFLVLPYLKLRHGLIVLGALNVIVGMWILLRKRAQGRAVKTAVITGLMAAGCVVLVFRAENPAERALAHEGETLEFYEDGPESSVAIVRSNESGDLHLLVDGDGQAGTSIATQIHLRLLGHLPALLHPNPKNVLCVAFGAGISAGCLTQHPVDSVDIVELSRSVIRGSVLFEEYNHDPLHNEKVNLIRDDGRNHLLATDKTYDVITSDPIDPDDAGVTSLYSREYYELVSSRLNSGGVACQWLSTGYDADEDKMLIRTFQSVFPHSSIWYGDFTTILVGVKGGPHATMADLRERLCVPSVKESLGVIGISRPEDLLPLCLAGPGELRAFTGEGPLNTDDLPLIEYLGPRYGDGEEDDQDENSIWNQLMAARKPDMSDVVAGWTEEDQAAVAPAYGWMTSILKRHMIRYDSYGIQDWKAYKKLSGEEKDRRDLEKADERAEKTRERLDLTWDILGSSVPRLYLILSGIGQHEKEIDASKEDRQKYDSAILKACTAWQNGELEPARMAFVEAASFVPADKRAPIMAAACLDRAGDRIGALKAMLLTDIKGMDRWSELHWFAIDIFSQVLYDMNAQEADREEIGRELLALTPDDKDRPEQQERDRYPGMDDDRPPKPKPTETNASDVDAWRLWLRDASTDLEIENGRFVWRKDKK